MRAAILVLAGLALLLPTVAVAAGPLDVAVEVGVNARYVWRGMVLTDATVVQPEIVASVAGFGLGIWGNMDADDVNGYGGEFNEYDLSLTYGVSVPLASFDVGVVHYALPNATEANTTEAFATAQANVLFSPSVTVYHDIDRVKGGYWEAGAGHGVTLGSGSSLDFAASVGLGSKRYVGEYFPGAAAKDIGTPASVGGNQLTDARLGVSVPFHPVPKATITPSVVWSTLLGEAGTQVSDAGGDKDGFIWGISAGIGF